MEQRALNCERFEGLRVDSGPRVAILTATAVQSLPEVKHLHRRL